MNVISFDNNYCSSLSEHLISIVDSVNPSLSRRLLEEETSEVAITTTTAERMLATTVTTVNFYSISIDEFESDLSWNTIIKLVSAASFATDIAAYVVGLPAIVSVSTPVEIVKLAAPIF